MQHRRLVQNGSMVLLTATIFARILFKAFYVDFKGMCIIKVISIIACRRANSFSWCPRSPSLAPLFVACTNACLSYHQCTLCRTPHGTGGGEVGGRVTRTEWREHHADQSALIPEDDAFCAYLQAVWKTKGISSTFDGRANQSTDNVTFKDESRAHDFHRSTASSTGPDASGTPDRNRLVMNMNSGTSDNSGDESRPPRARQHSPEEIVPCQAPVPFEAWGARVPHTVHNPVCMPGRAAPRVGDASGTATMCPGVRCLLDRARGSLAAGGVTGAFRLLKGLREMDENGNGKVTLSGFKKAVGDAGLGLKEAEMRIVFEVNASTTMLYWQRVFSTLLVRLIEFPLVCLVTLSFRHRLLMH